MINISKKNKLLMETEIGEIDNPMEFFTNLPIGTILLTEIYSNKSNMDSGKNIITTQITKKLDNVDNRFYYFSKVGE